MAASARPPARPAFQSLVTEGPCLEGDHAGLVDALRVSASIPLQKAVAAERRAPRWRPLTQVSAFSPM